MFISLSSVSFFKVINMIDEINSPEQVDRDEFVRWVETEQANLASEMSCF